MNVRPQSLMSYIQDTMIERKSRSSTSLPSPARRLAEREPLIASTPNGIRSKVGIILLFLFNDNGDPEVF